jgi:Zn-dependent peptidase ImmA (M78 family)/DNA-binding XRE family transcriptional regulator
MFTPSRLTLARKRRGFTKKALAKRLSVTAHTVLRYESGEIEPPASVVQKISEILDFPASFFFEPDIDGPSDLSASFRSLSAMSAGERDAALAAGTLGFLLSDWVERHFDLPDVDLDDLSGDTPEVASRSLREKWGIGERPIKNMAHLAEAKGIRLFSMAENTLTVDAFSLWRMDKPYIFLNTLKSAEHNRYDIAHEIGHLVLHRHGGPRGRLAEDQANLFASSFLMPAADVMAVLPRVHTLNQVIEAKKRWGVSTVALIVRLHHLNIMTDWQYRTFCVDATEFGYRKSEPFGMKRELSVVWKKVLTTLWTEKTTRADIAQALHIPSSELENLLFGLAGGLDEAQTLRPPLRLVSGE